MLTVPELRFPSPMPQGLLSHFVMDGPLWWFTGNRAIAVTALLPIILYPLCDVTTLAKTLTPYASDTIYLFLGGFLLAAGIQRLGPR